MDMKPFDLLPDALDVLFSQGVEACIETYPELQGNRDLLQQLHHAEALQARLEESVQDAADLLGGLEMMLRNRLVL